MSTVGKHTAEKVVNTSGFGNVAPDLSQLFRTASVSTPVYTAPDAQTADEPAKQSS
jgi:hypothetical protein